MKDPSAAMQAAIHAKLVASSAIATAMGGTAKAYDKAPDPRPDPFIRVGDDQAVGDSNSCADGWEFYATVHTFSADGQRPRMVAKELMNHVAIAVGNEAQLPAPTGFVVVEVELVQSRTFMEADGVTAHGVQTFRYLVADGA